MTICLHLLFTLVLFDSVNSFVPTQVTAGSPPATVVCHNEALTDASAIVEYIVDEPRGLSLGAWMPLGSASSLTGLGPTQIRVCGIDLAVWHKPLQKNAKRGAVATEWSALVDACPHRLAPLSQGRVDPESGCIECPYHGWSFDTDGSLQTIPQLDEGRTIKAATGDAGRATSLPVHAAGDLLFVFLPTEITGESWPISHLPEHHYSYLQEQMDGGATYYARDFPYSFDFLLENLSDMAHIPIAHNALLGNRKNGSPMDMKVTASNFTHYECEFKERFGKKREGVLTFERPAFSHVRRTDNLNVPQVHFFASPIDEGRSRVMMKEFGVKFIPKWLLHLVMHLSSNPVTSGDIWLHDAERSARVNSADSKPRSVAVGAGRAGRKTTYGLNYIVASRSDVGTTSFRKWWSTYGFADAPPNTFGPASESSLPKYALSSAEQNDPWSRHAKNCIVCRRALSRMRVLQKVVIAGASIGAIMLQRRPPFAMAYILLGISAHDLLGKLATTIEGNTNRAEIRNRSYSATH